MQCVEAAKKAPSAPGIIKRTFSTFEISSFALLYKTYVRCHMGYCVQAWNPYYRKDINILEKIQRRATKVVPESRHLSYIDRLKRLKLTSLEDRRQRGDLIETYKIISGKGNIKCDKVFKMADSDLSSITSGNSQKLYKPKFSRWLIVI